MSFQKSTFSQDMFSNYLDNNSDELNLYDPITLIKNYKKKYLPPEKFVNLLKKRFSPYCSVATWYLWRSIDPEPIQY